MSSKTSGISQSSRETPKDKPPEITKKPTENPFEDINPKDILIFRHPLETKITKSEILDPNNLSHNKNIIKKSCISDRTFFAHCSGKFSKYTDYHITPIQKAITYCMIYNGGSATSDQIVSFVGHFWDTIRTYNNADNTGSTGSKYVNPPNKRIINMNFSFLRNNQPLFISYDDNKWGPNTVDGIRIAGAARRRWSNKDLLNQKLPIEKPQNSQPEKPQPAKTETSLKTVQNKDGKNEKDDKLTNLEKSHVESKAIEQINLSNQCSDDDDEIYEGIKGLTFQDFLMEILKRHGIKHEAQKSGMSIESITRRCKNYQMIGGAYSELPLEQRVKATLHMKKHLNEVCYNEKTQTWSLNERKPAQSNSARPYIPSILADVQMRELTVNDLWNLLKDTKLI